MERSPEDVLNTSGVKRNLQFNIFESTPLASKSGSRKRKSLPSKNLSKVVETQEQNNCQENISFIEGGSNFKECSSTTSQTNQNSSKTQYSFEEISFRSHFQSSPITNCDDFKLSSSLEKCTLDDFNTHESQIDAKKFKWDDDIIEYSRKSNSAPGTPQRSEHETDNYIKKYHSLEFTPTKGTNVKIGTPERYQILYPELVEVKPATKPKSPQKLRNKLKRLSKPARKRLFQSRDFIYLFTKVSNQPDVISKIFSYLNDTDLVHVANVSSLWRLALESNREAYKRYKKHVKNITISKENIGFGAQKTPVLNSSIFSLKRGNIQSTPIRRPPGSPPKDNWKQFTKIAEGLNKTQTLQKCLICSQPAVVEKGIAQCSKYNCGYIWCLNCFASSKTGPVDFLCTCMDVAQSPSPPFENRFGLSDISNIENSSFSFFNYDPNTQSVSNNFSSGYFSQSDVEKSPIVFNNNCMQNSTKGKSAVLTDYNKNSCPNLERRMSDISNNSTIQKTVALKRVTQNYNKKKDTEPVSPQKIKMHPLGSKQSKKNLRRLCF